MKKVFDIRTYMVKFAFYGNTRMVKEQAQRQLDLIDTLGTWQWDCQGLTKEECSDLGFGVFDDWLVDECDHKRLTDYEYKEFLKGWL